MTAEQPPWVWSADVGGPVRDQPTAGDSILAVMALVNATRNRDGVGAYVVRSEMGTWELRAALATACRLLAHEATRRPGGVDEWLHVVRDIADREAP